MFPRLISRWWAWLLWFWDAVLVPLVTKPMDMSQLDVGLWQGGMPQQSPTDEWPQPITAVLNLQEEHLDNWPSQVLAGLWLPITDGPPAPSLDWLNQAVDFIERSRARGLCVLVHCAAGVSRSSLVTVAWAMKTKHLNRDKAMEFVASKRPVAHPNPAFWDRLAEYEKAN